MGKKTELEPPTRKRRKAFKYAIDMEEAQRIYFEEGLTLLEIAPLFNVSPQVLCFRFKYYGIDTRETGRRKGCKAPNRRGWSIRSNGYKVVQIHEGHPYFSMANRNGYVAEHRLVMAETLGRPLTDKEVVHHKNHNKLDNHPDNLHLYGSHSEHMKEHSQSEIMSERAKRAFIKYKEGEKK